MAQKRVQENSIPGERAVEANNQIKCLNGKQAQLDVLAASGAVSAAGAITATGTLQAAQTKATDDQSQANAEKSFGGLNWGIGFGYSFGVGPRHVDTAELDNGVVRVTADSTNSPKVFLESHYLFENKAGNWGWGPFASLEQGSSTTTPIAFGLGLITGWKDRDPKSNGGFLLGIGFEEQSGVKTLGDGITANAPLPAGETQVRYKTRSAGAIFIMLARKFDLSTSSSP